jgi:hypothetical protein
MTESPDSPLIMRDKIPWLLVSVFGIAEKNAVFEQYELYVSAAD